MHDPFHNRLLFLERPRTASSTPVERPRPNASPIVHTIEIARPPEDAYWGVVSDLGQWSGQRLTPDAASFSGATIEGVIGSAVTLELGDESVRIGRTWWRSDDRGCRLGRGPTGSG